MCSTLIAILMRVNGLDINYIKIKILLTSIQIIPNKIPSYNTTVNSTVYLQLKKNNYIVFHLTDWSISVYLLISSTLLYLQLISCYSTHSGYNQASFLEMYHQHPNIFMHVFNQYQNIYIHWLFFLHIYFCLNIIHSLTSLI